MNGNSCFWLYFHFLRCETNEWGLSGWLGASGLILGCWCVGWPTRHCFSVLLVLTHLALFFHVLDRGVAVIQRISVAKAFHQKSISRESQGRSQGWHQLSHKSPKKASKNLWALPGPFLKLSQITWNRSFGTSPKSFGIEARGRVGGMFEMPIYRITCSFLFEILCFVGNLAALHILYGYQSGGVKEPLAVCLMALFPSSMSALVSFFFWAWWTQLLCSFLPNELIKWKSLN